MLARRASERRTYSRIREHWRSLRTGHHPLSGPWRHLFDRFVAKSLWRHLFLSAAIDRYCDDGRRTSERHSLPRDVDQHGEDSSARLCMRAVHADRWCWWVDEWLADQLAGTSASLHRRAVFPPRRREWARTSHPAQLAQTRREEPAWVPYYGHRRAKEPFGGTWRARSLRVGRQGRAIGRGLRWP